MQTVGANYRDGAPLRFYGNAPPMWANYNDDFAPGFFGFGNTLGINQTFDASINQRARPFDDGGESGADVLVSGVQSVRRGRTRLLQCVRAEYAGPVVHADRTDPHRRARVDARLFAQHLTQLQADANATSTFGPQFPTSMRATFDKLDAGARFPVSVGGKAIAIDLAGTLEHLRRNDASTFTYIPYNPALAATDPGALANVTAAAGASAVSYYTELREHVSHSLAAGASMPVTHDIVLNTRYSDQRYFGSYGTTIQQNIGGTKDQIDVGLMYSCRRRRVRSGSRSATRRIATPCCRRTTSIRTVKT